MPETDRKHSGKPIAVRVGSNAPSRSRGQTAAMDQARSRRPSNKGSGPEPDQPLTSNAQPRQNESLACFSVDGQRCDIVCENASFNGRAVVGTLILGERTYLVLGGKAEAVPDLMVLLTPRELDIAVLVSKGWKVKEIARRLDISFNTVRVHTGRIYAKLNMHKQSELAICVAKQSWPRRRAASISDDFQKKTRNRRELGRRHPAFPAL